LSEVVIIVFFVTSNINVLEYERVSQMVVLCKLCRLHVYVLKIVSLCWKPKQKTPEVWCFLFLFSIQWQEVMTLWL